MTRTRTMSTLFAFLTLLISATAAIGATDASYRVRSGDYLGRIASRLGVTVNELKRANSLRTDVIQPDQLLKVPRPFRRTTASGISWRKPNQSGHDGVLRAFGTQREGRVTMRRTGVDLHYDLGGGVLAPADAVVRYVGEQDGYGIIMILEHGANYATVLGPFEPESVSREIGDVVLRGDRLGRTGPPVEGNQAYLHVELRRNNEAIDPARLIR